MNYCGNMTKSVMLWEIFVDLLMRSDRREQDKGKDGQIMISTREKE